MKYFRRNVFRLAKQNKGSFAGAVLIIAIGIFIYVSMMDTLKNLEGQVNAYYEESALADVFAEVSGISEAELTRLADIPGIVRVSGRMAEDVRLLAPDQETIVTVHLLSYEETDVLNQLTLEEAFHSKDSLYLGGRMSSVYEYEAGTALQLLRDGTAVDFEYAGACHAPDYIYSIPPGGAMLPDGEVYDIACISKKRMEELTGKSDSLNELGFRLQPGYTYEDVRYPLSEQLEMYGLISLTERSDQTSVDMVEGEIGELIATGTVMPAMFMAISIFMLYVVLKKMIDRDQSLIGTMKAFGMTDRELMGAYLMEGVAAGVVGAALGSVLAIPFGQFMFGMYVNFFNLPDTVYHSFSGSRISGLAMAVGTGLLAVFLGVRDILSITPAQAMRAKAPTVGRTFSLPDPLMKRLGPLERLGCRFITRNPFRGFLLVLAVGFPFSMASVLFSFSGVADQMYMDQFEKVQVYDLQVSLDGYTSPLRAAQGVELLPGIKEAEAVCRLSASLKNDARTEFVMLYGLNSGSKMWRVMDSRGMFYQAPERGLILNSRIAKKLHVSEGELVELSCPGITAEPVSIPVVRVIEESLGSGCYIALDSLGMVLPTRIPVNTVVMNVEKGKLLQVKEKLMDTGRVTYLVETEKIIESYRDMMGSMLAMMNILSFVSVLSGGILIYNISMINIRDRVAELGTLMVLGSTNREIGRLLGFEQTAYFILGILLGIPGSYGIRLLVEKIVISDTYSIEMTIFPGAYLKAFVICLLISVVAWAAETRFIGRIHLADILKERE